LTEHDWFDNRLIFGDNLLALKALEQEFTGKIKCIFIDPPYNNLNHEQLQALSDEVGAERSLLVVCSAFRGRKEGYANLTVKKIPKAILARCEWGHDDYSLQVENLPKAPPKPGQIDLI
jgi:adenine-specific DNA-methyltransferase